MGVAEVKLLVDCTPLHSGGGVQVAIALLEGLRRQDDIDWLAVVPQSLWPMLEQINWGDGRVIALPKLSRLDMVRAGFVLAQTERRFKPDVVFTVFGTAYFRARTTHLVGFALPNLIYDYDGPLVRPIWSFDWLLDRLRVALFRKADHIVVETETVRTRLAQRLVYPADRISVIRQCVNPLLKQHAQTPLPAGPRVGVFVPSAYYRHKNLEIIPPVAALMAKERPDLDFEFRLTLPRENGNWRAIAQEAERLGVGDRVVSLGSLTLAELAVAYRSASIVFLPTLREASTAVYPESFYFRRPLVTSDMDFARELCGDAALYVPPFEPEAIARTVLRLAQSPELARQLVHRGTQRLDTQYTTPDAKLAQQIDLLRKLSRSQIRTSAT